MAYNITSIPYHSFVICGCPVQNGSIHDSATTHPESPGADFERGDKDDCVSNCLATDGQTSEFEDGGLHLTLDYSALPVPDDMSEYRALEERVKRQILGDNIGASQTANWQQHCTAFVLPSAGVLGYGNQKITLTTNVLFTPQCTGAPVQSVQRVAAKVPFYASSIPQTYVIAAVTVIAYILLIMLLITPRVSGFRSQGNFTSGGSFIRAGGRPWFQKLAAGTVAISLTVASADTMRQAKHQFDNGFIDATYFKDQVLGSLHIKLIRVVSDIALWLAMVQTLIRIFPRHKEKVLIKWIGFALIFCDTVFACLNATVRPPPQPTKRFSDAIPALLYLFELTLGLLYAAWVMWYAILQRKYAFYHKKMRSVSLVATLAIISVFTPIVFFCVDVANPSIAAWGDYTRWVGGAAASVTVWEWVDRIEALRNDEKKDGILGREVFDGDEMLDITPTQDLVLESKGRSKFWRWTGDDDSASGDVSYGSAAEKGMFNQSTSDDASRMHAAQNARENSTAQSIRFRADTNLRDQPSANSGGPTPLSAIASTIPRTNTISAASTEYVVRYHPTSWSHAASIQENQEDQIEPAQHLPSTISSKQDKTLTTISSTNTPAEQPSSDTQGSRWYSVFRRNRGALPLEVQAAAEAARSDSDIQEGSDNTRPRSKDKSSKAPSSAGDQRRPRKTARQFSDEEAVIIPAPSRGARVWTPDDLYNGRSSAASRSTSASNVPTSARETPLSISRQDSR